MTKTLLAVLATSLTLAFAGCTTEAAPSFESLSKKSAEVLGKVVDQLETVKDADTAKAAEKKIEPMLKNLSGVIGTLTKLGKPSEEQKEMFMKAIEPVKARMEGLTSNLMSNPMVATHLQPLLEKIGSALEPMMK